MTLMFLTLSAAFAGETDPVAEIKAARESAIAGYRAKMEAQKTAAEERIGQAEEACATAKTAWLSMQAPLASTESELKLVPLSDTAPEIAEANATYRKSLEKLAAGYKATIAKSLKDAKASGDLLSRAESDLTKVNAELKRLDAMAEEENATARYKACTSSYDPSGLACLTPSSHNALGGLIGSEPTWHRRPALSRTRQVYLPVEFTACFPNEVEPVEPAPSDTN